ncbi:hypothetical protein D9M73_203930 [compost metagenome]
MLTPSPCQLAEGPQRGALLDFWQIDQGLKLAVTSMLQQVGTLNRAIVYPQRIKVARRADRGSRKSVDHRFQPLRMAARQASLKFLAEHGTPDLQRKERAITLPEPFIFRPGAVE